MDAERQQLERERLFQARKRGMSDVTEVPTGNDDGTSCETFADEIEWQGVRFKTVRIARPQKGERECALEGTR